MRFSYVLTGLAAAAVSTGSAQAATVIFSTLASFQTAATTTNTADFESLATGATASPLTNGGIKFSIMPGETANPSLYVAPANGLTNTVQLPTQSLAANGDERFRIELADGAAFNAIGFNLATNRYHGNFIALFGVDGGFLEEDYIAAPDNSVIFFGLTSSVALGHVEFRDKGGWDQDDGMDNVRIARLAAADPGGAGGVPEPATWALMLAGFGLAGTVLRRARPALA